MRGRPLPPGVHGCARALAAGRGQGAGSACGRAGTQTELSNGAPARVGDDGLLVEAQHDLAALKQRLVDSEIRAVETKQNGAAREATIQRGACAGTREAGPAREA